MNIDLSITGIKICGLTSEEEVGWILEEHTEYFGIVVFYPKSRRNMSIEKAAKLIEFFHLEWEAEKQTGICISRAGKDEKRSIEKETDGIARKRPRAVAVTVSPTVSQLKEIENAGFDLIQIHGNLTEEVFSEASIPIIRAFNRNDQEELVRYKQSEKIAAYLFDAVNPGSGKTFDWTALKEIERGDKLLFLAGGLHAGNVREAIEAVWPDVVDVSSGVERDIDSETEPETAGLSNAKSRPIGKDREKIREFVRNARNGGKYER